MPAMNPIMMIQIMFDTVISPLAFACNVADETCKDPLSSEAPYTKSRLSRPMAPFTGERSKGVSPRRLVSCLITEACGWCYGYSRPATGPKAGPPLGAAAADFFYFRPAGRYVGLSLIAAGLGGSYFRTSFDPMDQSV
jgi:hypothetical protein